MTHVLVHGEKMTCPVRVIITVSRHSQNGRSMLHAYEQQETTALCISDPLLRNFEHFAGHSTRHVQLSFVAVSDAERVVAVVPTVKFVRQPFHKLIKNSPARIAARMLGPLGWKTSLLIDTSFLAYDYGSPFRFFADDCDRRAIARCAMDYCMKMSGIDSVMIAEPTSESYFHDHPSFDSFAMVPMSHVELSTVDSWIDYLSKLSKKRRRNCLAAQRQMSEHGVEIGIQEELSSGVGEQVYQCLHASAERSAIHNPYQAVATNELAFLSQSQEFAVASQGERVVGFASFIQDGSCLLQTHGGLDYDVSTKAKAYHNLMYALIREAITRGCDMVSFGPLNNETKRRIGTDLRPLVASLWNRKKLDRLLARKVFLPNFQVYHGPYSRNSFQVADS